MAIFRINKDKNYTTISNYHLKDTNLSLKAKGLLSIMLSLPENWDYSVKGLTGICNESKNTINGVLKELEINNYLVRRRIYCDGKISDWEYNIYENNDLHPKNEDIENEDIENWDVYKYTKELNTKEYIKENNKRKVFNKPTIEEIDSYCKERNNCINANTFYDFYESKDWMVGKNKMKDWKAAIRTWEQRTTKKITKTIPDWFNKDIESEEIEPDEDFKNFIEGFRNE